MLVYIHVPFCRRKCRYCAFYSEGLGTNGGERLIRYAETLFLEMAQWSDRLGKQPVRSVFFGGGTPSLLPANMIGHILNRLGKAFTLDQNAEITLEANPESLNTRKLAMEYRHAGVNRISLGIQSLDDTMLAKLGRPHEVKDALQAYSAVRSAGFAGVNLDFIWGLPDQSVKAWLLQLGEILRLQPDHLSCYNLTLEKGTPMHADFEQGEIFLPEERDQAAMYVQGAERLEEAGLMQYEISNFARMGYQCRHNLGYWEGEDYIGFGPAATSTVAGRRWTNPYSITGWQRQISQAGMPGDVEQLDPVTRVLELIMLRLRTTRGLRVKAYQELTGRNFFADHQRLVHTLHKNGLIRIRDGYLRLTRSGMLVSDSILAAMFDASKQRLLGREAEPALE